MRAPRITCPVDGCTTSVIPGGGGAMCKRHWDMLPDPMRTRLYYASRAYLDWRGSEAGRADKRAALRQLQWEAIQAVNAKVAEAKPS